MEKVNVYDFDKTILPYDSTEVFFRHCLRRYPRVLFPALGALPWAAGMPLGLTSKTRAKEVFYRFLALVPDIDAELTRFWELHLGDINAWYLARRRGDDIVSSASPEFLLRPVAGAWASVSSPRAWTGTAAGPWARTATARKGAPPGEEYPGLGIAEFYSDSLSDAPLARLAERAFLVKGQCLSPWPERSLRP
ncbi:MAG: haloacid dehalogenase-like hydrolase [Lachnospiraceae bacterium]